MKRLFILFLVAGMAYNGEGQLATNAVDASGNRVIFSNDVKYQAGVTNGGCTINGASVSNGAALTISGTGGGADAGTTNWVLGVCITTNAAGQVTAAGTNTIRAAQTPVPSGTIITNNGSATLTLTANGVLNLAGNNATNGGTLSTSNLLVNGKSFPTAPAAGDMMRYDGTNWVATGGYTPRGTNISGSAAGGWDWCSTNFTHDGAWHSMTIPSFVPASAKYVTLSAYGYSTSVGTYFIISGDAAFPVPTKCIDIRATVASAGSAVVAIGSFITPGTFYYISTMAGVNETTRYTYIIITGWGY